MQDLFRRLVGGRSAPPEEPPASSGGSRSGEHTPGEHTPGERIPGAPFTRDELPALLGEKPALAEFVAGRSDAVSEASGVLPLAEAGLWLTFLGDAPRAAAAFRAAAAAQRPEARYGAADALALARRESLPVEAGVKDGLYLALAGDEAEARRAWLRTVEQYGSLVDLPGAPEALAASAWSAWRERLAEIERGGPGVNREPDAEPHDPAKLGRISAFLSYAVLRLGDSARAAVLLDLEAAVRAAAPDARLKRYYADTAALAGGLTGVLRGIVRADAPPAAKGAGPLAAALRAYLQPPHPEAQAFTLDLQRAFPDRVPAVLPPADLTEALGGRARKRLEEARR
jgi:hypothetical protein